LQVGLNNLRAIMRPTGGFMALCAAVLWAAPALANIEIAVPVGSVSIAGQGSAESAEAPPSAAIHFSRAADLPNQQQIYFSKARFSGPSAVISMSTNRRAIRRVAAISAPIQRRPSAQLPMGTAMALTAIPSQMPVSARALTSGFGMRGHPLLGGRRAHSGIDLAAPTGSPIVATSDGLVSWADWAGGYGIAVAVEHGGGYQTRYAHMSRVNVAPGQQVRKGDVIGYVGSTGMSTGPHLHYEVRVNGQAINPVPMLGR
jgi:murein DD-endopeptidase MepM/ murein hydrolase activator NlpD